jgi:hypothetical protein
MTLYLMLHIAMTAVALVACGCELATRTHVSDFASP